MNNSVAAYVMWALIWIITVTLCTSFVAVFLSAAPVVIAVSAVFFGLSLLFIPFTPYLAANR